MARAEIVTTESRYGAVSWGAILAGAIAGAALALVLFLLGTGLGLAVASPWAGEGASAKTIGVAAVIWLLVVHLASSGLTGYIAGRLRTRWEGVDRDELVFRDSAHGLVGWAVGVLFSVAVLGSAVGSAVGGLSKAGAEVAGSAVSAGATVAGESMSEGNSNPVSYVSDMLFRGQGKRSADDAALRSEARTILVNAARNGGEMSNDDRAQLSRLVASGTGLSQAEADKRVADVLNKAKEAKVKAQEAADAARKAAGLFAGWSVLALLIGAFAASLAAVFGGKLRDEV